MATRRRKITRSAVRRVKRRESKNAKLRTLRSRKNSSKRMRVKQRGGGIFGNDPDDFFSIYSVQIYRDFVPSANLRFGKDLPLRHIIYTGALYYNHKTKKFHLFTLEEGIEYEYQVMKIVLERLLGGELHEEPHKLNMNNGILYYNEFDGKNLNSMYAYTGTRHGHKGFLLTDVPEIKYDIKKVPIPFAITSQLENKEGDQPFDVKVVDRNEKLPYTLTFSRFISDEEAKNYQIPSGIFDSPKTKIDNGVNVAYLVFPKIGELQKNRKNETAKKLSEAKKKWEDSDEYKQETEDFWNAQRERDAKHSSNKGLPQNIPD